MDKVEKKETFLERKKRIAREKYHYKKSIGLCVHSGCTNPAVSGRVRCEYHLSKDKANYIQRSKNTNKIK